MEKKSKFKKFLAASSALAVIVGSSNAMADLYKTTGNPAQIADAVAVVNAVSDPAGQANWVPNSSIYMNGNHDIELGVAAGAGATVGTIDINNRAGRTITAVKNSSAGSVISSGGAQTALLVINDGVTFTLTDLVGKNAANGVQVGGVYTGLGNITLGAGAGGSTLQINSNATLAGTIDSDANDDGIINVGVGKTVVFNGLLGNGQALGAVNLADGSTVTLNKNATVGNAGFTLTGLATQLNVGAGKTITGKVTGGALNNGILNFEGAGVVTDLVGNVQALKEIRANAAGVVELQHVGAVAKAEQLTIGNAGTDVQLAKGFTGLTKFTADGQVTVADNGVITGAVTTTSGDATGAGGGKLVFKANGTVTGLIGAEANRLSLVQVGTVGAGTVDLITGSHYAKQFQLNDVAAKIQLADNGKLFGNIVANANLDGQIIFKANGAITGQIGDAVKAIALVQAGGVGAVEISGGDHKVIAFDLANAGSVFKFADGANITGTITNTSGAANGTVNFLGNGKVTGTTGAAGIAALATLNLAGDSKSAVLFGDTITATNVNIDAGTLNLNDVGNIVGTTKFTNADTGTLLITGDNARQIGAINLDSGNRGTVEITNAVGAGGARLIQFKGKIGDNTGATKALKLFSLDSNNAALVTAQFNTAVNGSNITAIKIGAGGGILDFAQANSTYKIGGITTAADKGTLKISQNTTFQSAAAADSVVNFGDENTPLAAVEFANAKVLTLGKNINVYATKVFATAAANNGTITFEGNSIFSAAADGNTIHDINVNGADSTVKLLKVTNIGGTVTIADTANLEISSTFTALNLRGKAADNGKVKFTNAAAIQVAGTVGAGASLKAIEFAGANVEFTNVVTHTANNEFIFSSDKNATTVKFDAGTNIGGNNFTNNTTITHKVVLAKVGITDFTGTLGAADKQFNFELADTINAKISGAANVAGANFTTSAHEKGQLVFNSNNNASVNSVGTQAKSLELVTFTTSGGVNNGLFAKTVDIAAGQTATLGGRILATEEFKLADDGSRVLLSDGAIMDSVVSATKAGKGIVEFAGNATLNKNIGTGVNRVDSVKFGTDATKTVNLNTESIFAETAIALTGRVALTSNITLDGPTTTANGTTLSLGDKKMTVAATKTLIFNGANELQFELVQDVNNTRTGSISALGTLEYNTGTKLNIVFTGAKSLLNPGESVTVDLITSATDVASTKALDAKNVTLPNSDQNFIKWTVVVDANGKLVRAKADDNAESALLNMVGPNADAADRANIHAIANAAAGTDGGNVRKLLSTLSAAKVDETLDRLAPLTTVSDAIESTSGTVNVGLTARMDSQAGNQSAPGVQSKNVASSGTSGVAAGDDSARFGVWASPFFGRTTQKAYKNAAGYRSDLFGASFGFDTRANEDMIIGAAFTVANNTMKHKNFKSGDKTKIGSLMFSLYGMQQITDNWFTQMVATFGSNEVKNSEKRVASATTYDIVRGKYTSMSFNGEAMFGYNVVSEQASVTPMAGLRYSRVNDGGYKEAGSTTGQNIDVNTKASNKLEVVGGLRIASAPMYVNNMTVTPEVHGFVNYDLIGKNPKQTLGLAGTSGLTAKGNKPIRATYNLGLGATAEYGMMEYGVGYDAEIATKRLGHQGTLKVRVNF